MSIRYSSLLEGITAGFSFGTASIFARYLIIFNTNVYAIAFYRLLTAAIILGGLIYIRMRFSGGIIWITGKRHLSYVLVMGILIGLHFIFFISAVRDTYIVNATVLVNTTPIIALALGVIIFNIRITRFDILTVLVAFLGGLIISLHDLNFRISLIGDLEAVLAALLLALYVNIGKKIRISVDVLHMMSIIYIIAIIPVLGVGLFNGLNPVYFPLNIENILLLIAIGAIPTAIGHTLYISSLKGLKPFETATLALLEPVSASILAYLLFSEMPNNYIILGAILILSSVAIITYRESYVL